MAEPEKSLEDSEDSGYSYTNPAKVASQKNRSGRREQVRKDSYKALMSHPHGRQLVFDLLTHCGMFTETYTSDDRATFYQNGRRSVGLYIQSHILLECGKEYTSMLKENLNG